MQFRLRALEGKAVATYKGIVKVTITYDIPDNDIQFEVSEKYGNKIVALTHSENGSERSDVLGVRWNFYVFTFKTLTMTQYLFEIAFHPN